MKTVTRAMLLVVSLAICLISPVAGGEGAFSGDADRIEAAAKSVLVLELYGADGESLGTASGFVAFDNRTLVTSFGAIAGATTIVANSEDGFQYIVDRALVLDEARDVAILGFFSPTDLVPLTLDAETAPKRAQTVVAIGSPMGLSNTVSIGTVSAVYEDAGVNYIQFTAPISPGPGGALFDESGAVVGLLTGATDGQNVGTAVRAGEIMGVYGLWDGATTSELPAATTSESPAATDAPRDIAIAGIDLVWCEAGWSVEDPNAPKSAFSELMMEDLMGTLDFYALLTFSVEGGAAFADAVLTFGLYDGATLLDETTAEASFGPNETSAQRYFDITALIRGIPAPGTYEVACALNGVEAGRYFFDAYWETDPNPTPAPVNYASLAYGDTGDAVRRMQAALISLGYLADKADGVFGKNTSAAVADFNLANGICVELYAGDESYYDRDPEVAWNETLQLLYDGDPLPYVEPYMPLDFPIDAYAQWNYLDSDELKIHFEVQNIARYETIESFTLYVYATDYYDYLIYGENQAYSFTTWKKLKPGATAYSDYVTIPYLSQIYEVHCGIAAVTLTSGEEIWLDGGEVNYWYWVIDDYD